MKLSMHTNRLAERFGAIGAVKMIAEAGFEAVDYSMYSSDGPLFERGGNILAGEIKRVCESYGLIINQAHAPFTDFSLLEGSESENKRIYDSVVRSIILAGRLGTKTIVIHPALICPRISEDERFMMNMELYSRFIKVAREVGVGVAIENIYARHTEKNSKIVKGACSEPRDLIRYADELSGEGVGVCFDVGHAGLVGENAAGMVKTLGNRITNLHVHDNDFESDSHTLPYLGEINFSSLSKALGRVGYQGDVTLESDGFIKNMPDAIIPSALLFSRSVASHIRDEIIKYS